MRRRISRLWEWIIERFIQIAGILGIVLVLLIFYFLLRNALPLFEERTLAQVLSGTRWSPTHGDGHFGMLPLILGSLYVTAGALVLSIPLGLATAIFIAEIAPRKMREIFKPAVEMLAAIPSVVFGFLGMMIVGPWIADRFDAIQVGQFAALGSIMLCFMALPTIVSICEDAFRSVPREIFNSSLALGATRWQTITRALIPAARSGVIAGFLLGLGRAIGETMTVLMVTGNAQVMPEGLEGFIRPIRTMTATIAAEMGETPHGSTHFHSLFTIGLILFVITFGVNTIADIIIRRSEKDIS